MATPRISDVLGPVSADYRDTLPDGSTLRGVWLGQPGAVRFEACELVSEDEPGVMTIRAAWRKRRGQRAMPLIVFWQGVDRVLLTEPTGEPQVTVLTVAPAVATTVIQRALSAPRREAVTATIALLERAQGSGGVPGFRNRNILSTHYVTKGFQRNHAKAWAALNMQGSRLQNERGVRLLRALGYTLVSATTFEVLDHVRPRVHAVVLPDGTPLDKSPAGPGASPTTRLLVEANARGAERAVIVSGGLLRIYVADATKGLDDVATASNYIELDLELLDATAVGLLPMFFGAEQHQGGALFDQLVAESTRYALELRGRFRERVYSNVVGDLARALYAARGRRNVDPTLLYAATLRLLYRLLFVLYAEDRNLLPLGNSEYRRVSLTETLFRLEERRRKSLPFDARQTTLWDDLFRIFEAIRSGNVEMNVPAYNGGLFEPVLVDYPEAAFLDAVTIPNSVLAPILLNLGFDEQGGHRGKVDFGDLGVRHLGTLYEGLLSFSVRVADEPLTVDEEGLFVPAKAGDENLVKAGDVYVTSPKGGRKASGSHYTPTFIVRRLLDNALQPVLERHLESVVKKPPEEQWAAMLEFHVVDPAMGSGHFLVDALDVIANRFATFLADNPRIDAGPVKEAREQITVIGKAYGIESLGLTIGDFELLRRIVMRNCIYGVDLNPMAVELAKLSLWLHAFVPGLPLSFLGHNLRHGNALVGVVGPEIADKVGDSLFGGAVSTALQQALEHAKRLTSLSDLSYDQVKESVNAQEALEAATAPIVNAFDAYSCRVFATNENLETRAQREMGRASLEHHEGLAQVLQNRTKGEEKRQINAARDVARALTAFHWQIAFPEVFLRENPGFNVILGNPPWDKVRFEEQQFWVSRVPGLNALAAGQREKRIARLRATRPIDAEQERQEIDLRQTLQVYFADQYKHQGRGHLDLSKLFAERVLSLVRHSGSIGYVLPGQSLIIGGWSKIRELISDFHLDVVEARNTAAWMFADADPRLPVVSVSISSPPAGAGQVVIVPGISSFSDLEMSKALPVVHLSAEEVRTLSDAYVIPWLNSAAEVSVLNKMRSRPSLRGGKGWITGQSESKWDFSASGREHRFVKATKSTGSWNVLMARHVDQFKVATEVPFQRFITEPKKLIPLNKNIVVDHGRVILGADHARIVYRYPARSDDSRTMIATYLPDHGYLPSTGYIHAVAAPHQDRNMVLALLGFMNSLVADWWVRRFVDRHVTAPVVNALPLPAWSETDILRVASEVGVILSGDELLKSEFETPATGSKERDAARLKVEIAVVRGFGLEAHEVRTILAGFSDTDSVAPRIVREGLRAIAEDRGAALT